ncbi:MAG TPA: PAS domain-containing protein, partial [Devosia sp.]|nr:PAS domain-containing protein [Devosia sp.]
ADLREAILTGTLFRKELRLLDAQGGVHWVIGSGRPRLDEHGKAYRFPGVLIDVTEQHHIAEALAESEQRFRTLADSMPQMVWSTAPDGTYDYFNARWSEFTGLPAEPGEALLSAELVHPEDRSRVLGSFQHSLATGETYQEEHRLRHHSGEFRWILARAMPLRDPQGQIVRWIGTSTDIHQSKLAAEERDLVSQELSHRIKNIFAVLTGIISLSARSRPESKPFADELRQRIYALGEAHDFVRPRPSGAEPGSQQNSLQALVQRLMQPYGSGDHHRVQFLGDDAEIDDGAATPLALLFHELATNAAKYGALSAAGGTVILTGQAGDQRYHLGWKERGGPDISYAGEAPGFGSRVIQLSVEGQLHGRLERFWESDGLRVEIDLPGAALRRSARLQEA